MPSATDKYRTIGDMWERGMALLAWKLDGRGGTIVDDVVDHRGIGSGRRDYRTIRGGRNNKYKASNSNKCMTRHMNCKRYSNVGTMHVARDGNSSEDESPV